MTTTTRKSRGVALGALLLALAGCSDGGSADAAALTVSGAVERPADFTLQQLRQRPAETQTVSYVSGSANATETRGYTGTSAWALLDSLGFKTGPAKKGDLLNRYVIATGSDGYRVVFSLGELNPAFGNKQSLVVYDETRSGATVPLGADGPLLMTAPGDGRGSRYLSNLVQLEVREPPPAGSATVGGASGGVAVTGAVNKPQRFDVAALQALPATTLALGGASYTGVNLWTLLSSVTGIRIDAPQTKRPTLRMAIVATGSDGYQALIALPEIDPQFGNRGALLAYSVDGTPLDRSGPIRLVLAGDVRGGRSVSNLERIDLFSADAAGGR